MHTHIYERYTHGEHGDSTKLNFCFRKGDKNLKTEFKMTVANICSSTTKIVLPWRRSQSDSSILEDTC